MPLDKHFPMVATQDVGRVAAKLRGGKLAMERHRLRPTQFPELIPGI
jgi:hypothetical protein